MDSSPRKGQLRYKCLSDLFPILHPLRLHTPLGVLKGPVRGNDSVLNSLQVGKEVEEERRDASWVFYRRPPDIEDFQFSLDAGHHDTEA